MAGEKPPKDVTKEGNSVVFASHIWYSEMDVFKLNIPPLYFRKKKRRKVPDSVKMYDGRMGVSIADFTPSVITRRQCTGIVAKVWDLLGKLAPVTLKLKYDLRKLIVDNPEWDSPLSDKN